MEKNAGVMISFISVGRRTAAHGRIKDSDAYMFGVEADLPKYGRKRNF